MRRGTVLVTLLLALAVQFVLATRTGDEADQVEVNGLYYVFADAEVDVIDPLTMTVVTRITSDAKGNPLTDAGAVGATNTSRTWNDPAVLQNTTAGISLLCVNQGDIYLVDGQEKSYVDCIDTTRREFVSRIVVGARPVHLYVIDEQNMFWSHSDAEGLFYSIPVAKPYSSIVSTVVPDPGVANAHGKLVIDPWLYPVGYGSNVAQQVIPRFDFLNESITARLDYSSQLPDPSACAGTHTIVYSNSSQHIYAECIPSGILEFNVLNNRVVALHTNFSGTVTVSPANDRVFVVDSSTSTVNILVPGANDEPSTIGYTISVPGNPGYPEFYSNSTDVESAPAYQVYFPLTRVTNVNNIRAAAARGSSVLAPGYTNQPSDCQYAQPAGQVSAQSVSATASQGLKLATGTNGSPVTPNCGACAPGVASETPSQFNASLSGFGLVDFAQVEVSAEEDRTLQATLVPAGAVNLPLNEDTDANQCSYGEAYRRAYRGGPYVGITANYPQSSIY
ncbi:hypothetical protein WJX73_009655 [Symbiochloris irregularis]|uniref:YncE family protein n=1 Tax=Symbiochloris irregularis TaxID=706552 RepID=A0AAW1NNJ6_9CHLO